MAMAPGPASCRPGTDEAGCEPVEVFVILIPPFIALLIGAWAVLSPKPVDAAVEHKQLNEHIAWLEERLVHARARNWDEQMMANLHAQMAEARRKQQALATA